MQAWKAAERERGRQRRRQRLASSPSLPPLVLSQATPTPSPFLRSFFCLIHIPSAFAFKNPHPECCRQLSSFLSSLLSRNFIGLAGRECRAFFPMADLHNCLSQRCQRANPSLPCKPFLMQKQGKGRGKDEQIMLQIYIPTQVAYFATECGIACLYGPQFGLAKNIFLKGHFSSAPIGSH